MGQGQEQLNKWADRGKLRQENKPHCGPHETGTPPPPLATTTSGHHHLLLLLLLRRCDLMHAGMFSLHPAGYLSARCQHLQLSEVQLSKTCHSPQDESGSLLTAAW